MPHVLLLLLTACDGRVGDTAAQGDTGTAAEEEDRDGDGFPAWNTTSDPARADCDDDDPAVTPATEIYVPAGPFTRGQDDLPWASPVRTITLSAYCIDRTEVTNSAFVALLQAREADGQSNIDDDGQELYNIEDLQSPDPFPAQILDTDGVWSVLDGYALHPVVEVYHWSGEDYCASVGKALPTEAQWEKAARGDADARQWPWGDVPPDCGHTNYVVTTDGEGAQEGDQCVGDTAEVGSYPSGAAPGGAVDMAGNVSEWVADWFDPEEYADDPDQDPTGPAAGAVFDDGVGQFVARVSRGGGFLSDATAVEVATRMPEPEGGSSNGVGFRCARALPIAR